ncbi:YdcF family protein [Hymenobacter busanensis]|uniref:YdcF family protein n=1 Tax=Hymenobacter busanensis TaxID=2607656 RepID=A0A7L4ZUI4_9BACT|nr:YdcF family protein [Hymenobacter busanensis]KAA9339587.1 YdcF family protein [Hymenobacter busanensis]QHJ06657.1 YdcF family protein [Hymenobacter busanensis]
MLSKILDAALSPALWLVAVLLAAVLARGPRWRRRWLWLALGLTVVLTNNGLSNLAMRAWELPPVRLAQLHPAPYDAAVLLTGITETRQQPRDRVYIDRGADRLLHTLWLYRAGKVRRIIITGGSGALNPDPRARTEARELAVLLRLAGVPAQAIWLEERSRNTHENAEFTRQLLQAHPEVKRLVLVTSAFHMRRAAGCFHRAGLQATPFPATYNSVPPDASPGTWLLPDADALVRWGTLVHEMVGYAVYRLQGYC